MIILPGVWHSGNKYVHGWVTPGDEYLLVAVFVSTLNHIASMSVSASVRILSSSKQRVVDYVDKIPMG